jgi:hypothetical protein
LEVAKVERTNPAAADALLEHGLADWVVSRATIEALEALGALGVL